MLTAPINGSVGRRRSMAAWVGGSRSKSTKRSSRDIAEPCAVKGAGEQTAATRSDPGSELHLSREGERERKIK